MLVQVVRAAESCAATMAGVLPPDMVVRVLNPIVKTGDFPVNQVPTMPDVERTTHECRLHLKSEVFLTERILRHSPGLQRVM